MVTTFGPIKQSQFVVRVPEHLPEESLPAEHKLWSDTVTPAVRATRRVDRHADALHQILHSLDKTEIRRQEFMFELIQTERSFIRQLNVFRSVCAWIGRDVAKAAQVFRQPMSENISSIGFAPKDLENLFSNLDDVITTNQPLYELMNKCRLEYAGKAGAVSCLARPTLRSRCCTLRRPSWRGLSSSTPRSMPSSAATRSLRRRSSTTS